MIRQDELILDTWSDLDFKGRLKERTLRLAPDWVGDQRRRLEAYVLLESYKRNASKFFLNLKADEEDVRDDRRELGESEVITSTIVAAILGTNVSVTCENSELETWARGWARKVKGVRKLFNAEDHAVSLGDAVFVLSWDERKQRVDLKVYNPGFYFPVLDGASDDEFPERVHIAWEFVRDNGEGFEETWIRRRTWDITSGTCRYTDGEWRVDDLELSSDYDTLPVGRGIYAVNSQGQELRDVDLKIDFIPVVHQPNTSPDDDEHFGRSSLANVLQIIDEIQATDTDLAKGASIAGFPPLASDGATMAQLDETGKRVETYGPGTVFTGHLSTIDTSKSLDALIKYLDKLLGRLAVNSHLPEAVIGRVKPSEVPSGLAFALGFTPLISMLYRMRLIRDEKRPLIFKFAYRLSAAAGVEGLPPEPTDDEDWPTFSPGPYLPSDVEATINIIQKAFLVKPRVLSLETAVKMLVLAGLPIADAEEEVKRIIAEDFEGAQTLASATTDPREAFKYLSRNVPDDLPFPPSEQALDEDLESGVTDPSRKAVPGPEPKPVVS